MPHDMMEMFFMNVKKTPEDAATFSPGVFFFSETIFMGNTSTSQASYNNITHAVTTFSTPQRSSPEFNKRRSQGMF